MSAARLVEIPHFMFLRTYYYASAYSYTHTIPCSSVKDVFFGYSLII